MTMVELRAKGVSATLDCSVGHIADFTVETGDRIMRPLHRAPWVDDASEPLPDGLPENVARLSGDFFCAPFSRNDVEDGPPHGWTANSAWDFVEETEFAQGRTARFRLRRCVMDAVVEKLLTLRDGHPFLYQEHRLIGGQGAVPVAHHTMIRMANGGSLAFSPKKAALTPDAPLETDPARGRSLFAYPARTSDLSKLPLADGTSADLSIYPPGERHEDFVTLVEEVHAGIGYTAIARHAERDLVLVLKNPASLPVTMLWYSNGGRNYAPWSSRHVGVLGIEDACSAIGHRQSLEDNAIRREGAATAIDPDPSGQVVIRQVIGCLDRDDAPVSVQADRETGVLQLAFENGSTERIPFDTAFLG
jgi:hypothetical protein